ncbi:MAG: phosphate transport system permease protein PstA, partial [Pseudomonadota bacterium]
YGTGGILWASLTLSLLTVPVVIVSTEEALSAVPRSLREASYGCGATRMQTLWRIVLPKALPGVMTGLILAMARAVGEVAPLLMTGVVKLAPALPVDGHFPFVHLERSFMHLGFHIYDLGFQSRSTELSRPMVFASTSLLVGVVLLLNFVAIKIRSQLRKRFEGRGAF